MDKLVEEVRSDYETSKLNIRESLTHFISIQNSEITGKNYMRWISQFLNWCGEESVDPVKISRKEAESYMIWMMNQYSPNTVRCCLLGTSSFFTYLRYDKSGAVKLNVFQKMKLPKGKLTRRVDIITESDIEYLKVEFTRIKREDICLVLDILKKYGYRVGVFEGMKVDRLGNFVSESKGSSIRGKFTPKESADITRLGICGMKGITITNIIKKYSNKLFKMGVHSLLMIYDIRLVL